LNDPLLRQVSVGSISLPSQGVKPVMQSKIEPVSAASPKFGNISNYQRRFPANFAGPAGRTGPTETGAALKWPRKARAFLRIGPARMQRPQWLAEETVLREPVSIANSLLTGKNTGKFSETPESEHHSPPKLIVKSAISAKFPTPKNRECPAA
jgi:hypothetical protein